MQVTGSKSKCSLVPESIFDASQARSILSETVALNDSDEVAYATVPAFGAIFLYVPAEDGSKPELLRLLESVSVCSEYYKVIASIKDGLLYLVIAQGDHLLLANCYPAPDFTTALYFIFLAMKSLQMNPEVCTISLASEVGIEDEETLYRYFSSVEKLSL